MDLNNTSKFWTVTLEEDPGTGDLILPFPEDFIKENDWQIGDTLNFIVREDKTCVIENLSWQARHSDKIAKS